MTAEHEAQASCIQKASNSVQDEDEDNDIDDEDNDMRKDEHNYKYFYILRTTIGATTKTTSRELLLEVQRIMTDY